MYGSVIPVPTIGTVCLFLCGITKPRAEYCSLSRTLTTLIAPLDTFGRARFCYAKGRGSVVCIR